MSRSVVVMVSGQPRTDPNSPDFSDHQAKRWPTGQKSSRPLQLMPFARLVQSGSSFANNLWANLVGELFGIQYNLVQTHFAPLFGPIPDPVQLDRRCTNSCSIAGFVSIASSRRTHGGSVGLRPSVRFEGTFGGGWELVTANAAQRRESGGSLVGESAPRKAGVDAWQHGNTMKGTPPCKNGRGWLGHPRKNRYSQAVASTPRLPGMGPGRKASHRGEDPDSQEPDSHDGSPLQRPNTEVLRAR